MHFLFTIILQCSHVAAPFPLLLLSERSPATTHYIAEPKSTSLSDTCHAKLDPRFSNVTSSNQRTFHLLSTKILSLPSSNNRYTCRMPGNTRYAVLLMLSLRKSRSYDPISCRGIGALQTAKIISPTDSLDHQRRPAGSNSSR